MSPDPENGKTAGRVESTMTHRLESVTRDRQSLLGKTRSDSTEGLRGGKGYVVVSNPLIFDLLIEDMP